MLTVSRSVPLRLTGPMEVDGRANDVAMQNDARGLKLKGHAAEGGAARVADLP